MRHYKKIKLDKVVYDLFTNYYYYKILSQNLDYFRIVISRINNILSSCEDTTKKIINMNRALIENKSQEFQAFHNSENFNGIIDEKYDLYLSPVHVNEQQIIIRNYDEYNEYVENGGKADMLIKYDRFEDVAQKCVSARDIYMEIIDKLPLFFERQVTDEDEWARFYSSNRLNASFLSIKSIVIKSLKKNDTTMPDIWVDAEIVKLIDKSTHLTWCQDNKGSRTGPKREKLAQEVFDKACEKYVDRIDIQENIENFKSHIRSMVLTSTGGGAKKRKVKGGIGSVSRTKTLDNLFRSCNQFFKKYFQSMCY